MFCNILWQRFLIEVYEFIVHTRNEYLKEEFWALWRIK